MNLSFAFSVALLLSSLGFLYGQGVSSIKGQLKDSATGENLANATLILAKSKDTVTIRQAISGKDHFILTQVPLGKYFLKASHIGYRDTTLIINIRSKDSLYDLGILLMQKFNQDLMEVVVESTIPLVITKSDTVIYNTSAFKTRPNATVQELLKKLPGIEVDKNGNITFQSEKIQKIYIDGKEFFFSDPKFTSQNLLADMVQKVEAFDDKSERAKLTGIPDEKPDKALNLRLKPDKKNGYFGNVEAGYTNYDRYNVKASVNHFKENAMAMIGGDISNNGVGRINSQSKNIYLNYQKTLNQNLLFTVSYGPNANNSRGWAFNQRQTFIGDSSLLQDREGTSFSEGAGHNVGLNVNYVIDSLSNLGVTSAFVVQSASNSTNDIANSSVEKSGHVQLVNSAIMHNNSDDYTWNGNLNLTYNHGFIKQGRFVGVNFSSGKNRNSGNGGLTSLTTFYDSSVVSVDSLERNQIYGQYAIGFRYGFKVSYTEPIGKNQVLDFYCSFNGSNSESDRSTYNYNPMTGKYDQRDSIASNRFVNTNGGQTFGVGYNNFKRKKLHYQAGVGMSKGRQQNINKTANLPDIKQTTINIFPRASLMYSISKQRSVRLAYSGNNRQPRISELQPVPDFSNPLLIRFGNPSLKAEFNNQVNLEYKDFNSRKMRSFTVNLNYRTTINRIANSVLINAQGVQEQQYVNMNGDYGVGGSMNYDRPLVRQQKRVSVRSNTSVGFFRDANLINRQLNKRISASISQGLAFNYHLADKLFAAANCNVDLSATKYSLQAEGTNALIFQRYSGNISYELPWKIMVYTDFNMFFNYMQGQLKRQHAAVWNASIMKKMFKDSKGEVKLSVLDILNTKKTVTQNIGDNYIETTGTEVMGTIFNLSFIYRFRGNKLWSK